jgi:hypothetical protein
MNTRNLSSRRGTRRVAALLIAVASAALTAALAGPAPSASAMSTRGEFGGPGSVFFDGRPVLDASAVSGGAALSTGAAFVTPDPSATKGPQTVKIRYILSKRVNGTFKDVKVVQRAGLSLASNGTMVAGSGTIATVSTGHLDRYRILVIVDWYSNNKWQSQRQLEPNSVNEISCRVSGCTAGVADGVAYLGLV